MIEAIGLPLSQATSTATNSTISQDEFLRLMTTQLSFQDPLEPMDNQELLSQLAQFTSLEISRQTNEKIDSLLTLESTNQALQLLGKTVQTDSNSGSSIGSVTTIDFNSGIPQLTVEVAPGEFVSGIGMSQIVLVRE